MSSIATAGRDTIPLVREEVRSLLMSAPAFRALDADKRRELAHAMVNVGQYLADAGGDTRDAPLALALEDPPPRPDTAGAKFEDQGGANAAESGTESFTNLVNKTDFPGFVRGLIDGVFNAIVTSSIQQMEAYGELVKNLSKTVDAYMKDNISENQARDQLAEQYPDHLEVDTSGESPVLKPKPGADTEALPDFFKDLGLDQPVDSVDDDTPEQVLVPAARRKMAMDRQQMLLVMVLMGVNRLVVTDGQIKAKVTFHLDTIDRVGQSGSRASKYDSHDQWKRSKPGFLWSSGWENSGSSNFEVTTTRANDSEAQVRTKADLMGEVNINFKSETFPLTSMTDVLGLDPIKAPTRAPAPPAPGPAPASPAPAAR